MTAVTVVRLGDIVFEGFSLPENMPIGGEQSLSVKRMIGGRKQVQAMGPDHDPIVWNGIIYDEFAELKVFQLDLLRISGRQVQLTFATRAYLVVVRRFVAKLRKPQLYDYEISCEVVTDQVTGNGGQETLTREQEIAADLVAAQAYAQTRDDILFAVSVASTAVRAAMGDKSAQRGLGSLLLAEAQDAVADAVLSATGSAAAANAVLAATGGLAGIAAGNDPAKVATQFLATTVAAGVASEAALAGAHMTNVQTNLAAGA